MKFLKEYIEKKKAKKEILDQIQHIRQSIVKGEKNHLENFRNHSYSGFAKFKFNNQEFWIEACDLIDTPKLEIRICVNYRFITLGNYNSRHDKEMVWDENFPEAVAEAQYLLKHFDKIVDQHISETLSELKTMLK